MCKADTTPSLSAITRHCEDRSRQRGFKNADIALVYEFGSPVADGYLITRDDLHEMLTLPGGRQRAERLLGAAVIEQDGRLVTIFRSNKSWRRQATGRDQQRRRALKLSYATPAREAA